MAKADAIMEEIGDYVFQLPVEQLWFERRMRFKTVAFMFGWVLLQSNKQNNKEHNTLPQP
jgi:hypothetical protein